MSDLASHWAAFLASPYFWDIITLACLAVTGLGFVGVVIFLLGLPGRIAVARNHPDAEAVYAMGWVGFAAVIPWIQALIWAFKPTDKVDIRYFPAQEREAERRELEELEAYAYGRKPRAAVNPESKLDTAAEAPTETATLDGRDADQEEPRSAPTDTPPSTDPGQKA